MDIKKEGTATEIAKKEELTPNERKEELLKAGLDFHKIPEIPWLVVTWVIWGILCLLPTIAELSHLEFLGFALELYVIKIPMFIVWIAVALLVALMLLLPVLRSRIWHFRTKKGGCDDDHHTVVLIKEGLYRIVRHPEYTFYLWLFILVSIAFSPLWRFTVLTIVGDILLIIGLALLAKQEEAFNIRKWEDEYKQYMKEVPRFNFIQGLWRLRKKKKSRERL